MLPLIALFAKEKGCETVASIMPKSVMSSVNIAEVAKFLIERQGFNKKESSDIIQSLVEIIILFDTELALVSADLTKHTKPLGLSLGDRSCLALAISTGYTVYSTDRIWSKLDLGCKIILIR